LRGESSGAIFAHSAAHANVFTYEFAILKSPSFWFYRRRKTRLDRIDNVRHFDTVTIEQRETAFRKTMPAAFAARR
jgi:hypothetical protein